MSLHPVSPQKVESKDASQCVAYLLLSSDVLLLSERETSEYKVCVDSWCIAKFKSLASSHFSILLVRYIFLFFWFFYSNQPSDLPFRSGSSSPWCWGQKLIWSPCGYACTQGTSRPSLGSPGRSSIPISGRARPTQALERPLWGDLQIAPFWISSEAPCWRSWSTGWSWSSCCTSGFLCSPTSAICYAGENRCCLALNCSCSFEFQQRSWKHSCSAGLTRFYKTENGLLLVGFLVQDWLHAWFDTFLCFWTHFDSFLVYIFEISTWVDPNCVLTEKGLYQAYLKALRYFSFSENLKKMLSDDSYFWYWVVGCSY